MPKKKSKRRRKSRATNWSSPSNAEICRLAVSCRDRTRKCCCTRRTTKQQSRRSSSKPNLSKKSTDPDFGRQFVLDFFLSPDRPSDYKLVVYNRNSDSGPLDDADRLGTSHLHSKDLKEVVDNLNIDFHCKLAHENPSVQSKLVKLHSTVVLHCIRRIPIMSRPIAPIEADPEATSKEMSYPDVLKTFGPMMSSGRNFVFHQATAPPAERALFFRKSRRHAGTLHWCSTEERIEDPARTLFLDHITDIYVGKHSKDYSVEAGSDRCFSIVARSKNVWLDLEAKTNKLRESWVSAILLLLKNRVTVKVHKEEM